MHTENKGAGNPVPLLPLPGHVLEARSSPALDKDHLVHVSQSVGGNL